MQNRKMTTSELQRRYRNNPAMRRIHAMDSANVRMGAAEMKVIYEATHPHMNGKLPPRDMIQKKKIRETRFGPISGPSPYKLSMMRV